jgi:hypothetical protein
MRNLYRLLGFSPKRNYEFLDSRPVWSEQKSRIASAIAAGIQQAGGRLKKGGWTDTMRVNKESCISVKV